MRYTDALIPLIEEAYADLFKNAELLGDMLGFKASEATRTPFEMVVECVMISAFLADTFKNMAVAPMDESGWEQHGFASLDDCKAAWEQAKPALFDAIKNFPQDKLEESIVTPWGTFTCVQFMAYCYWNPMWHAGQMAYIQMIHGDAEMHF